MSRDDKYVEEADKPELSGLDRLEQRQQRRIKKLLKAGRRRTSEILEGCREGHRCRNKNCVFCAHKARRKTVRQISVDAIEIPRDHRRLDASKLDALDASVELMGGICTPITVRKEVDRETGEKRFIVVTGVARLIVAKRRKLRTIPCFVVRQKSKSRLWHEIENLYRADLNVLERAESIERVRMEVFGKGGKVAPPGGRQPHDAGINKTAKRLGFEKKEVRRAKRIAAISPAAKGGDLRATA